MKTKYLEKTQIPEGIKCTFEDNLLVCQKDQIFLERKIIIPKVKITVSGNEISFSSEKGNKIEFKIIKACMAHIKNIFDGLQNKFTYTLEACNVHFPMTLKVEKNKLVINNFLGEKIPRYAKILPTVNVEIKGQKITVSAHSKELAGQTAANIEKATKVRNRDRRVFQDGIYLTEKPGEKHG